jgi:glycosyltransferase involved in cell wall biosynthesis
VALGRGGALETVEDGVTGILVRDDSAEAFAAGVRAAVDCEFDAATLRARAERFSGEHFLSGMRRVLDDSLAEDARW